MAGKTYAWCDRCRRSFEHADTVADACPICGSPIRELGWVSAFVRGFLAQEFVTSGLPSRHKAMIKLIWTANGMGERYFRALGPPVTYPRFESIVTDYLCQAASDGWVRFVLPPSPIGADDQSYRMEIDDEERFILEMAALFGAQDEPDSVS
ncbi:MAG TPA: hypothetical protein VMM78_14685 [Thermomicrobiales bacterium]|nr:hypothetical protein [Thermomicrobiales bacterium]